MSLLIFSGLVAGMAEGAQQGTLTTDIVLKFLPVAVMLFAIGVAWNSLSGRIDRLADHLSSNDREISSIRDQLAVRADLINSMAAKSEVQDERINQLSTRSEAFIRDVHRTLDLARQAQAKEHDDLRDILIRSHPVSLHPKDR